MGRLIDADAPIAQIWEKHKKVEESYDLCADELKGVLCGVVALVDAQPTAYDPDKVVEQLKKDSYTEVQNDMDSFDPSEVVNLESAIEIVEGGGVDEMEE